MNLVTLCIVLALPIALALPVQDSQPVDYVQMYMDLLSVVQPAVTAWQRTGSQAVEPLNTCLNMINGSELTNSSMAIAVGEEQLHFTCVDMTGFLSCVSGIVKNETGMELAALADKINGSIACNVLRLLSNMQKTFQVLCSEGSQLHADYLANSDCYRNITMDVVQKCGTDMKAAVSNFSVSGSNVSQSDLKCMATSYLIGCLADAIYDKCGKFGFSTFMKIVKGIDIVGVGVCNAQELQMLKTWFVDSFQMNSTEKQVYRQAFNLMKRRK